MITVNSFHLHPYLAPQRQKSEPSFEARKVPIDLNYVLSERSHLVPQRVLEEVEKIVAAKPEKMKTLKDVHKEVYAPLLDCKTLEEAQQLFPEFAGVKEANISLTE